MSQKWNLLHRSVSCWAQLIGMTSPELRSARNGSSGVIRAGNKTIIRLRYMPRTGACRDDERAHTCIYNIHIFLPQFAARRDDKRGVQIACWAEVGNEVACTGCVVASLTLTYRRRGWNTNTARVNGRVSKRSHSPNAIVIYNSYHLKRSEQIRSQAGMCVCLFVWLSERASGSECVFMTVKASKSSSCSSCLCDLFSPARCGWIKKTSSKLCTHTHEWWLQLSFLLNRMQI
jgi:hypothetical protein